MRLLSLLLLASLSGCYTLHDCINESLIDMHDHCEAHAAWRAYAPNIAECEPYPHHFGAGFKEGYRAVAAGGNGCPPTLAPRKYWCVCYQNDVGREKQVAWFNGYAAGAAAAQQEGVQARKKLVTASELYHQCPQAPVVICPEDEPEPTPGQADYFPEGLQPPTGPGPAMPFGPMSPGPEPVPEIVPIQPAPAVDAEVPAIAPQSLSTNSTAPSPGIQRVSGDADSVLELFGQPPLPPRREAPADPVNAAPPVRASEFISPPRPTPAPATSMATPPRSEEPSVIRIYDHIRIHDRQPAGAPRTQAPAQPQATTAPHASPELQGDAWKLPRVASTAN